MYIEKLSVLDEIIEGSPKYNITDNEDGTKDIELANEILQEGTSINKALFGKINEGFRILERKNMGQAYLNYINLSTLQIEGVYS